MESPGEFVCEELYVISTYPVINPLPPIDSKPPNLAAEPKIYNGSRKTGEKIYGYRKNRQKTSF